MIDSAIWKYRLPLHEETTIGMPSGSEFLSVAEQDGEITMWFMVPVEGLGNDERKFVVVGTGHPFSMQGLKFLGTVILGSYVWHVFEADA